MHKNVFFQLDNQNPKSEQISVLGIFSGLQKAGLGDSFVRLDTTSDDLSLIVNGVHIIRIFNTGVNSLPIELDRPEVVGNLTRAAGNYTPKKVRDSLHYMDGVEYRLPEISKPEVLQRKFNPYYAYHQVMGMSADEFATRFGTSSANLAQEELLIRKRDIIKQICLKNGIDEASLPNGYGFKRLKHEIEVASAPLLKVFKDKISGDMLKIIVDVVAQRYTPESVRSVQESVQRIASIFAEMYLRSRHYHVLIPKDQQLLTFFSQVTERVFGEKTKPMNMFIVACPRYGENDEYDRLEEGLSQTARTYLYSLPLFTTTFSKNGIPYRGYVLINDTEEQMAEGSLLGRLGLTKKTYRAKCKGNIEAVNQAIAQDERISGVSAHLLTEIFPDFISITASLEKQLYRLTQDDSNFRLAMARVADSRLARHAKIMGGKCDFSDSLYLSLHYAAEYMALGYLCRLYPELNNDSFIVNYNSPNVEQFNSQELLAKSVKGDISTDAINTIPVFQVKFY